MRSIPIYCFIFLLLRSGDCCLSTNNRAYSGGPTYQQYAPLPSPQNPPVVSANYYQPAVVANAAPRPVVVAAAANRGPTQAIRQVEVINQILGRSVSLHDFDSNGYNAEGGGPVNGGHALACDFDKHPCCWANVPQAEDQLDWQLATIIPDGAVYNNNPAPSGNYLVAHASNAVVTDEAQFTSCAIACASSEIVVRARQWHSEEVLLQVCLKESFPKAVDANPPMNCQRFPYVSGLAVTELTLPKASLVDIVFIASNFGGDGDIAILDDIEVFYETNGEECRVDQTESKTIESELGSENRLAPSVDEEIAEGDLSKASKAQRVSPTMTAGGLTSPLATCQAAKCNFESGTTCQYKDVYQTQSLRGLTTRFETVKGQFMNKVTGIKEGTEGQYYAATFLFPREMAGLAVAVPALTKPMRMRFQYYEGTHGVQLKACCNDIDHCTFSSDKFVSITDRTWKLTEFTCPQGTTKIIFVCENTRTNQGACAVDDIQVIDPTVKDLRSATTLC